MKTIEEWKVEKVIENIKTVSQIIEKDYDDSRYIQEKLYECLSFLREEGNNNG